MVDKSTNRISHSSRGHCSVSQRPVPCHVGLSYLFTTSELSGLMGAYPCVPDKSRTFSRPLHQREPPSFTSAMFIPYDALTVCSSRLTVWRFARLHLFTFTAGGNHAIASPCATDFSSTSTPQRTTRLGRPVVVSFRACSQDFREHTCCR